MTPDEELRDLRQSLLVYRLLLVGLVGAVLLGVWWMSSRMYQISEYGSAGEVWTVDLDAQTEAARAREGGIIDLIEAYFETVGATAHMHFMGPGQTTPMHLHPKGDELTLIADGEARVTLAWGEDGVPAGDEQVFTPGDLVFAPAGTGHEYANTSQTDLLAALVFARPSFNGNLYVKPDDARLLQGKAPFTYRPSVDLDGFRASGDPLLVRRLPALGGQVIQVITKGTFTVPANLHHPIIGWTFGGSGEVDGHALRTNVLVHLEHGSDMVLQATPGDVLGLVLFDPYGGLDDLEPTVGK